MQTCIQGDNAGFALFSGSESRSYQVHYLFQNHVVKDLGLFQYLKKIITHPKDIVKMNRRIHP